MEVVPPPEAVEAAAAPRSEAESLKDYVLRLARAKGRAVAEAGAQGTIIACDTLSEVDGTALGKPVDRDDARRMLTLLSGRVHRVLTGIWLCHHSLTPGSQPPGSQANRPKSRPTLLEAVEESLLEMGPLAGPLLDWYLDSGMWQGKAGACGFQDDRLPLRLVAGSGSNVVGLPLERLRIMLAELDGPRIA